MFISGFVATVALYCAPIVIDGDTVKCGAERIRLLGMDAPEMPGHCRKGRKCVIGDPFTSKANLVRILKARPLRIERLGVDRYGRTLALLNAGGVDASCAQIEVGAAIYVRKWDNGGKVRKICKSVSD